MAITDLLATRAALRAQIADGMATLKEVYAPLYEQVEQCNAAILTELGTATIDTLMDTRFQGLEDATLEANAMKAHTEALMAEVKACEAKLKEIMLAGGMQQLKTAAGMCFFTSKDSVTVENMDDVISFILEAAPPITGYSPEQWAQVLAHIEAHGMWGLLNKAVNKTNAKELIEANNAPPGVKYSSFKDLAWRRG